MLILIAAMMMNPNILQAQSFQWVSPCVSTIGASVRDIVTDAAGNSYITGAYDGTLTLGSFILTPIDSYTGYSDIFVAKCNSSGTVLWAQTAGGSGDDYANAICIDDSGHCYITGSFQDTATFGIHTISTITPGLAFVAKYNGSDGTAMWASKVRSSYGTGANGIAVDLNKVCIAGWFYVDAYIGIDTLADGDTDPMLATFNSHTGAELWGRRGGEYLGVEDAQDVAIDASGYVYFCGHIYLTSLFTSIKGSFAYPAQSITANGSPDFFIASYTDDGGLLTVFHASSASTAFARALKVDAGGNIYCAGTFSSTMTVGSLSVTSLGSNDLFVLKISSTGVPAWLISTGVNGFSAGEEVNSLAIDGSGNSYITGSFFTIPGYVIPFGSDSLTGSSVGLGIYVAKVSSGGAFEWGEKAGTPTSYNNYGNGIALDGSGNLYCAGSFDGASGAKGVFSQITYTGNDNTGYLGKINTKLHTGSVATAGCAGKTISVPYVADMTFNPGNVFTAQLSDVDGYFNSPVTIGTKSGKVSGTITATIPSGTTPGTNYRIRVIASSPFTIGRDNGKDISIGAVPDVTVTPPGPVTVCKPATADLSVSSCSGCFYQWYKSGTPQSGATSSSFSASKSGSYKVIVTSTGCSATSALVSVTVNPLPAATISPSGTVDICSTGSVVLTASSGAGFSYKWKKSTAYITGATSSTYTATAAGTYKVEITNTSGCSKTSPGTKVIKSCRKADVVSEENPELTVELYPNPVGEKLFVNRYSLIVNGIEVYDEIGRKVIETKISDDDTSSPLAIDVSSLNSGVYLVRLMIKDGNVVSQKFVKE